MNYNEKPIEPVLDIEIILLMEGIYQIYGYDFRDYGEASLKRRIIHWLAASPQFATLSEAQSELLRNKELFKELLNGITVNVSEMFRDPPFFKTLREQVIPHLKTYPFVKIWHAGCSTGEEAYSMAILLHEEGMAGRYRIYATDINEAVLKRAQEGIYPLQELQKYTRNYQTSGGKSSFSDYYTARYDNALFNPWLRENMLFSSHNLAVDSDFGEMNLILCRNVMIYFNKDLKKRVISLFDSSLMPGGFFCLGMKESLDNCEIATKYQLLTPKMQIYRKIYAP